VDKIPVGILGATGTVGQRFIQLLADHPWFEIVALAASDRSTGRPYAEVCHWLLPTAMPEAVCDMPVHPAKPTLECRLVFSALPADIAGPVEESFAQAGYTVCSNASAHRMDADVPLIIPEVNADHTGIIDAQRRQRGWDGLIVTSANCSATSLTLALKPLHADLRLRKLFVVTMQAVSGAGYPGVPSMDIVDNVIPYIGGEEGKMETESLKLLGTVEQDHICPAPIAVSAQCNRVAVRDGHTACVSIETEHRVSVDAVIAALEAFHPSPEVAQLPSTPTRPIVVRREVDRPQPIRDRDAGNGMSISVGRIRPCPLFDVKFVVLGHNTVRGAAGGSIHNAELLVSQQWIA